MTIQLPANEAERLEALRGYGLDFIAPDPVLQRIAELAAELFDTPMALVSLLDEDRQWLKASVGLDLTHTERRHAFCHHTIQSDDVMVVEDSHDDDRFRDNPYVKGDPNIRFYAGAPLCTPDGHRIGALCVLDDKPRRRLTDKERRRLEVLAKVVVQEMELHLANVRLDQARRDAEAAGRAREAFLANMSHELRTPLTAINGYAHFIAVCEDVPERERDFALKIEAAGQAMLAIVNDVLDLARLESGDGEEWTEPVDTTAVLGQALAMVAHQAQDKGVALVFNAPPEPLLIKGSAVALRQAVLNLLANAVKFTTEGEVRATIAQAGEKVSIAVEDTGIGIAPQNLECIFERFVQADASIQKTFGGTGLGLAITRRIVERMRGTIEATSELGKGSRFEILLPRG